MFRRIMCTGVFALLIIMFSCGQSNNGPVQTDHGEFTGRWALDLPGGAGWLGVAATDGNPSAEMLWYGGSVMPVSTTTIQNDTLTVTRSWERVVEKDDKGNPVRKEVSISYFDFWRHGDDLIGVARMPKRDKGIDEVKFTGKKIAALPRRPDLSKIKYGEAVTLFNGKNLDGWEMVNPNARNGFKVKKGVLVNDPIQPKKGPHHWYGNLRTVEAFEDFNLKIDVSVPEGSNSGIYLRGIYEVQILDSYGRDLDSHHMGGLYSRIAPSVSAEKMAGEWQTFDITLCDRHVTVILNGITIIDNQPLMGVTGGALTSDEFSPGPIYLQGDHGEVSFRNIVLTPILK